MIAPHTGVEPKIHSSNNPGCSSGFTVKGKTVGNRHSLTAGHCGTNGTNFYSGSHFYGEIRGRSNYPARDMARVSTSTYTNQIFTDGLDVYNWRTVVGANNGSLNQQLCTSGNTTKSKCNVKIAEYGVSVTTTSGTTTGLVRLTRTGGADACWGGDSGGPVYHRNPNNRRANVKGIISKYQQDGSNCFMHAYTTISNHLNVDVVVN